MSEQLSSIAAEVFVWLSVTYACGEDLKTENDANRRRHSPPLAWAHGTPRPVLTTTVPFFLRLTQLPSKTLIQAMDATCSSSTGKNLLRLPLFSRVLVISEHTPVPDDLVPYLQALAPCPPSTPVNESGQA
jgi:hypothetical protein